MKQNYLITVFSDGKNVGSYFSEGLSEIASIKAVNKGCEISVYDMSQLRPLTKEQINEISSATIESHAEKTKEPPKQVHRKSHDRTKNWKRKIKCVETGRVFWSIRECSEKMGIPHKAIWNALNSGRPRCGYHFVNVKNKKKNK